MEKEYFVYILANWRGNILYTGVTNDIERRMWEHKNLPSHSHAWKYNINRLVYYESFIDVLDAIAREKQIKGGSRKRKVTLVSTYNPEWKDLYESGRVLRRPAVPKRC